MVIDLDDPDALSAIAQQIADAAGIDFDLDDLTQAIADRAVVDPAFRARLDALAEEARRWLAEVEACGLARAVQGPDGIVIEILKRRVH